MIKAAVFDMFETLVSLFEGRTYFSEDIAADLRINVREYRGPWHATEDDRTLGKLTIEEGIAAALRPLGLYSEENVRTIAKKRRDSLNDTFSKIPEDSFWLLQTLREQGIKTALISNCFSDEAEMIKNSPLYPLFDVVMLSYEQGIRKPDKEIYQRTVDKLGVKPRECIYIGDGGSKELFTAKAIGMEPIQALWFRYRMFEPHIPCPVYEEFLHAESQADIMKFIIPNGDKAK